MKIKKQNLEILLKLLNLTTPKFVEARLRDRFLKGLTTEYKTFEVERIKICEAFADKDPKTKKSIMENNHYKFSEKNLEKFKKEYFILIEEEVKLKLDAGEASRLIKLIESTSYTPKPGEAEMIDTEIIANIK